MEYKIKPPLGIMPKDLWQEKRMKAIKEAVGRYFDSNIKIPIEWIIEYNELIK